MPQNASGFGSASGGNTDSEMLGASGREHATDQESEEGARASQSPLIGHAQWPKACILNALSQWGHLGPLWEVRGAFNSQP